MFCISVVLTIESCRNDSYNPEVCFQKNILPTFVTKCSSRGCHNSIDKKEEYDFTNYEGILKGITPYHPLQSKIWQQIKGSHPSMPPSGYPTLTNSEKELIKSWISFGSKNLDCTNTDNCDTNKTDYSYNSHIKPIMEVYCIGCHSSSSANGHILNSFDGIKNSVLSGRFLGAINQENGFSQMPKNLDPLTKCQITIIQKWIDQGMKN